ncbi:uncharacterized protein TrAtP1_008784 [Trichoderma atroviride]|uniref:uncharacterized protein n=1 Tax=Hypocrea atroviridis TaxID=63577 RepID=UPI0033188579|nr:hypothetical protein TrAtP1_008784 [Trichoderma atroviride]
MPLIESGWAAIQSPCPCPWREHIKLKVPVRLLLPAVPHTSLLLYYPVSLKLLAPTAVATSHRANAGGTTAGEPHTGPDLRSVHLLLFALAAAADVPSATTSVTDVMMEHTEERNKKEWYIYCFTHEFAAAMHVYYHTSKSIPTYTLHACVDGQEKKYFFGPQWASQRVISCSPASEQDSRSAEANQSKTWPAALLHSWELCLDTSAAECRGSVSWTIPLPS